MADRISVNSADLQQCVAQYRSALSTLKESYTEYTHSLKALSSDWTGRAFVIMSGKVAAMGVNIAKSFAKLEDAVSELGQVEELVEQTEKDLGQQAGNQSVGTKSPFSEG